MGACTVLTTTGVAVRTSFLGSFEGRDPRVFCQGQRSKRTASVVRQPCTVRSSKTTSFRGYSVGPINRWNAWRIFLHCRRMYYECSSANSLGATSDIVRSRQKVTRVTTFMKRINRPLSIFWRRLVEKRPVGQAKCSNVGFPTFTESASIPQRAFRRRIRRSALPRSSRNLCGVPNFDKNYGQRRRQGPSPSVSDVVNCDANF